MKYALVFTDEYPAAFGQDIQKPFRDFLLAGGSVGGGYADFIFPCRSFRSRTTNVLDPGWADGCVWNRGRSHFILLDAEGGPEVTPFVLFSVAPAIRDPAKP